MCTSLIQSAIKGKVKKSKKLKATANQDLLYRPQNLSMLMSNVPAVIDPEKYITSITDKQNLTNTLNNIYKLDGFITYVVIISYMPNNYTNTSASENSAFVSELANILSENNPEINLDSIIILFSIKDEVIQMRTGANVRKIITDNKAQTFIESIKPILYNKQYAKAATDLAQSILNKVAADKTYSLGDDFVISETTLIIIIVISVTVTAAIFASILTYCLCKRCNRPLDDKLNRIRLLTSSEESALEFIHENCIICLEDLKGRDSLSNRMLDCGHSFHKCCLTTYSEINPACPTCSYCRNIRASTEMANTGFQRSLVQIQSNIYNKKLVKYQLNYEYANFSYKRIDKKDLPQNQAQEEKKLTNSKNDSFATDKYTASGSANNNNNIANERDLSVSRSAISNELRTSN